jgi:hypothetical protein
MKAHKFPTHIAIIIVLLEQIKYKITLSAEMDFISHTSYGGYNILHGSDLFSVD